MAQDLHRDTGMTQLQLQLQLQAGTAELPTTVPVAWYSCLSFFGFSMHRACSTLSLVGTLTQVVRLKLRELLPKLHHSLSAQQRGCQFQYKAAGNVAQRNTPHDTGFTSLDSASHACFTSA